MADLKTRLIQLLDLNRSFQQQLLAEFSTEADRRSGQWENWSFKDELAHIVAWQLNSLARMAAQIHAEPIPDFDDYQTINRAIYDTNRDRTLAEIVAEADRAYAEYVQIIQAYSAEELTQAARFSDQEQRSLASQIMNNGYEHPLVHYADFYRRRGDLAKGTQLYASGVAALTDWPEQYGVARYNLACFYALNGLTELAVTELREALALRPDLIEWSKQDTDLVSLHPLAVYQALYAA
jgi:hypothetical protein